jgi:hypothetical protein
MGGVNMEKTLSNISIISLLAVFVLLIAGCTQTTNQPPNISLNGAQITTGNTTNYVNQTELNQSTIINLTTKTPTKPVEVSNVSKVITGIEGDLIKLDVKAYSPDGVPLTYFYTSPFNSNGLWQTKDGDAGKYLITVTASDGKLNSSVDVLVVVNPSNKPPVIDCPVDLYVKEGDTVDLKCNFFDKENDALVIEYSGWMNSPTYTTNYESSGDHKVFVTASDGYHNVSKTVVVHVENVDRAPIFLQHLKDMTITEGDIATLAINVTDPDSGDSVKLTYSEPFSSKGIWKTQIGDAGSYPISVVASDGTLSTKESFTLTVKMQNTAPVMATIANITVDEGDTVTINHTVKDRENNPITITYSGWMNTSTYTTTFDDAYPKGCDKRGCSATFKVTVTATDGFFKVSQDVYVTVNDKNRAPVFVLP